MKSIFASDLLLASCLASAPAIAGNVVGDVDQISRLLKANGYEPKREGSGSEPRIRVPMKGYANSIYFYGCDSAGKECKSVQFYAGFNPKKSPSLQAMNAYAMAKRWGRVYLDDEGDPIIEMDVDLEAGGMSEALFMDNIAYWETVMVGFADFVFDEK